MADIFGSKPEPSALLCDESRDLFFDDDYRDNGNDCIHGDDNRSCSCVNIPESESLIHFLGLSDEGFAFMIKRESDFLPKQDYLSRLRCGELDLGARREAFDWISKAHSYYSFGPLSLCLAVNYLDRFLSICDLPSDKAWAVQLLAVACLSIAAKVEETSVPQSIELQIGDPKFMFEAKTIRRMEILVLDTLNWRMNAVTPCSFLGYTLKKLSDSHNETKSSLISTINGVVNRSMQLILCTFRGIDFLEFKPSEISAAVAIFVSAEFQAVDIDNPIPCFTHLEEDRVMKCIEMIKGVMNEGQISPVGVLDEPSCFSLKTNDLTKTRVGSCPILCSHNTSTTSSSSSKLSRCPKNKRKRSEVGDHFYL